MCGGLSNDVLSLSILGDKEASAADLMKFSIGVLR